MDLDMEGSTRLPAPLIGWVRLVLLVNYWLEVAFAEKPFSRAARRKGWAIGGVSLAAGGASQ